MKKIVFIGIYLLPDGNGSAQRARMLAKLAKANKFDPIVIGFGMNQSVKKCGTTDTYTYYTMKYPSTGTDWIHRCISCREIKKILQKIGLNDISSIVFTDYYAVAQYSLISFCKKHNILPIIDSVDWFDVSKDKFPRNIIKDLETWFRMHIVNKTVDRMITISSYLKNYYSNTTSYIKVIPSLYDSSEVDKICNSIYIADDCVRICHVGLVGKNCFREKLDWVIEAILKLAHEGVNVELNVAGVVNDEKKYLDKLFDHDSNYSKVIKYHGRLSHSQCVDIVVKSDYQVIIRENIRVCNAGFSTKLSESFSCGTPVIVTPTSDYRDYIVDGKNGYISNTCDKASVCNIIKKACKQNKTQRMAMHKYLLSNNPLQYDLFTESFASIIEKEN